LHLTYDFKIMSVIDKIKNAGGSLFTFELLPPLKGHSIERIYTTIDRLIEFNPAYINFTSHRNEATYYERPDGLIEKKVVRIRPGTIALAAAVKYKYNKLFDMRPYSIVQRFGLKNPVFLPTASYGHFGRDYAVKNVEVYYEVPGSKPKVVNGNGKKVYLKKVEFFAWEKLDYVDKIKKAFKL